MVTRQCLVCGEVYEYPLGHSDIHHYRVIAGEEFYWVCPSDRTKNLTVDKSRLIANLKPPEMRTK